MNVPKVSIIMPVYNTEAYVGEAIESVLNQTFREWELILINDGSTDGSLEILQGYALVDARIRIINQANQGLSAARNTGLSVVSGDYVYFLDSDDYIVTDALFLSYHQCESEQLDFLFFNADTLMENKEQMSSSFVYNRKYTEPNSVSDGITMLDTLLHANEYLVSVCLLFISKKVIMSNHLSFYKGIVHEDELFTTELFLRANRVMYFPHSLFVRRVREESIMTTPIKMRNIDSYLLVAKTLNELGNKYSEYRSVLDLYLTKLLNAILWKAHVMPLKDRAIVFKRFVSEWYSYLELRSLFVLLIKKYLPR